MSDIKYESFFDIDSEFTKMVREENFLKQPNRWLNFYPHEKFVQLLTDIEKVIRRTEGYKGLSVWVEGAYGTGKSYAVLTLKKILDTTIEDVKEYFVRYNLSDNFFTKYESIKNERILTAYRSGSSDILEPTDLIVALQESILAVMAEKGLKGGEMALKEAGIRWLSKPSEKSYFQELIRDDEKNRLKGRSVDSIIDELKNLKDEVKLSKLISKCNALGKEHGIYAFIPDAKKFADWVKDIIKVNNIRAFVFIWDEFTEFFQNNLKRLTNFQEHILALADVGFFFVPVTHASNALFADGDEDKKKIIDRFVSPTLRIELPDKIGLQLIASALKIKEGKKEEWIKIADGMNTTIALARMTVGSDVKADEKTMKNILPLHPYTALVLKYISEKFLSNQRSMFDFLITDMNEKTHAFQWFIKNHGPYDDDERYMTVDYLWDFIYEKGKENKDLSTDIKSILDAHNRTNASHLNKKKTIVFKTILLMIAASRSANDQKELLRPNMMNLGLAFSGTELSGASSINLADTLVKNHILYEKDIAGGKKLYSVSVEAIDESDIQDRVEELKKSQTTSELALEADIASIMIGNPPLKPSLKKRFEFFIITDDNISKKRNEIVNYAICTTQQKNTIPVFLCVARDEREHSSLYKKIVAASSQKIPNDANPIVFIDLARTPMKNTSWRVYLENKAREQYLSTKDRSESREKKKLAEYELENWKKSIKQSDFELWFADIYENGETVLNLNELTGMFEAINKKLYSYAPETWCDVIDNLYSDSAIALGSLLGAKEEISGTYKNKDKPLENALGSAWNKSLYWEQNQRLPISMIKAFVDKTIQEEIKASGQAGIGSLYKKLQDKPWGFTCCNLCAFIFGFVLKEYVQNTGEYYYSDGDIDAVLTSERIRDMVKEAMQSSINPQTRPKEKYIKEKSQEEKQFSEGTAKIFNIKEETCFVGKIRDQLRIKLRSFVFPIWTLKEISDNLAIHEIIDKYLGVVNNQNYEDGKKTEPEIVKAIGAELCREPTLVDTLQSLVTADNCREGMKKYLLSYKDGVLIDLCKRLNLGEQYLETLKRKFDVEASTWVWGKNTIDALIDTTITEYLVMEYSNKSFGIKSEKPSEIKNSYQEFLKDIKVSYDAAKGYIKEGGELFDFLVKIMKYNYNDIIDFHTLLELLKAQGTEFQAFLKEQKDIFDKIIENFSHDLTIEHVNEIYMRIGSGHFTKDKSSYNSMVQNEAFKYLASLSREKLRKYWRDNTDTRTPNDWSEEFKTPVLALVPEGEIGLAKHYFSVVNNTNPDNAEAEKALTYLTSIKWWDDLKSEEKREAAFSKCIVGEYSLILGAEDVRALLIKHLTDGVYSWYSNDQAKAKIKELAQSEYDKKSVETAVEIVDKISDAKIKEYLKKLIRLNMSVGIDIISITQGNNNGDKRGNN
ncbi:MAG: hypothetical protein LBU04_02855 [Christensenellaceae bacterium]|jgi:hypothetical protein|nr:hypothetical protein [Christensenellaceae bacterium]